LRTEIKPLIRSGGEKSGLVVALNLVRYVAGIPIEFPLVANKMFGVMERNASCFNIHFSTLDRTTSYFYNFVMWSTITWVFHLLHPGLRGSFIGKSLKVYGLMVLFFASVSAIYMNHYIHPKAFYIYNILDALIIFPIVAVANGLLYPLLMAGRGESPPPGNPSGIP
ncbi:MAG: hypothetical protein ACHQKY_16215, partial [Terriglobia bacterium]